MTDNDIIKVFNEAINLDSICLCVAPSFLDKPGDTKNEYISLATIRDILNRQKEELDKCHKQLDEFKFLASRVNSIKNTSQDTFTGVLLTIAEGVGFQEAVAEVVERLKKSSSTSVVVDGDQEIPGTRIYSISEIKLDNLVKEMRRMNNNGCSN